MATSPFQYFLQPRTGAPAYGAGLIGPPVAPAPVAPAQTGGAATGAASGTAGAPGFKNLADVMAVIAPAPGMSTGFGQGQGLGTAPAAAANPASELFQNYFIRGDGSSHLRSRNWTEGPLGDAEKFNYLLADAAAGSQSAMDTVRRMTGSVPGLSEFISKSYPAVATALPLAPSTPGATTAPGTDATAAGSGGLIPTAAANPLLGGQRPNTNVPGPPGGIIPAPAAPAAPATATTQGGPFDSLLSSDQLSAYQNNYLAGGLNDINREFDRSLEMLKSSSAAMGRDYGGAAFNDLAGMRAAAAADLRAGSADKALEYASKVAALKTANAEAQRLQALADQATDPVTKQAYQAQAYAVIQDALNQGKQSELERPLIPSVVELERQQIGLGSAQIESQLASLPAETRARIIKADSVDWQDTAARTSYLLSLVKDTLGLTENQSGPLASIFSQYASLRDAAGQDSKLPTLSYVTSFLASLAPKTSNSTVPWYNTLLPGTGTG